IASVLHKLSHENTQLHREVENFPVLLKEAIKRTGKQITEALSEVNENSKDLIRRYRKEMKLRKKYHNELVELKGNIRVFVRARPKISEDGLNPKMSVSYDVNDDSLIYVSNQQRGRNQSFDLDRVFSDTSSQQEVGGLSGWLIQPEYLFYLGQFCFILSIFAYGQTGSGKTYTMEGTQEEPGINQRALSDLFKMVEERSLDWDYSVSVSLVEIYNETLKDLLTTKHEKLEIKMNADGTLFVQRLTILPVKDLNDVNRAFEFGRSNRATASTNMNEHSSRSHAVLMVTVAGTNKTTGVQTMGKLNLIDLAGSERVSKSGASGDRLKEAQNINRSLSALGDVIHSLRNKQSHVPFRNSKLTYLLQDSLSKDSKTLMVVQVSPVEKNSSETICSLTFAQRVRLVELGQATKKTK
uniref:Kinesin-like protein n=1 Tax=Ciona savignyi TaxID=51511 RepID=H2ZNU8_CIOSA